MGSYLGRVYDVWLCSGVLGFLMVIVWLLYPVATVTIYHPAGAIGFQAWLQGMVIPHVHDLTDRQLNVGLGEALVALAVLVLIHLVLVTLIYHRAQMFVQFWPFAVFLVGGIANGLWWWRTGHWDPTWRDGRAYACRGRYRLPWCVRAVGQEVRLRTRLQGRPARRRIYMIAVVLWLGVLCVVVVMNVLGLMPEQRARRQAQRQARQAARLARLRELEAERQRREWYDLVAAQKTRGDAGFAGQAEAIEVLSGRGGRRSNLDDRWFD